MTGITSHLVPRSCPVPIPFLHHDLDDASCTAKASANFLLLQTLSSFFISIHAARFNLCFVSSKPLPVHQFRLVVLFRAASTAIQ
jgi:hypothetical protein